MFHAQCMAIIFEKSSNEAIEKQNTFQKFSGSFQGLNKFAKISLFIALCLIVVATSATEIYHLSTHADALATQVTVNLGDNGIAIPSRFLGLSFETESICNIVGPWDTPAFEQLIKNLGPQVIRIGGNSSDHASWSQIGQPQCASANTIVTPQLIDAFFNLAFKINAKVMWTLNLGNNAPSVNSQEASYVINKGMAIGQTTGSFLWALGIGNEPDLYPTNGLRSANYSSSNFINEWNTYQDAIHKATNNASEKLMGPDIADNDTWFTTFLARQPSMLSILTHHFYAIHKNRIPANETVSQLIDSLLSNSLMQQTASTITTWKHDAGNIPLAITETNSITGGGYKGVSDTFASTLWGIDYMFTALEHGTQQMNFHTGGQNAYTPIAFYPNGQIQSRPLYYALLLFHYVAPNGKIIPLRLTTGVNLAAYAVTNTDGTFRLILINKDLNNDTTVSVTTSQTFQSATVLYLTAPSVDATTGVTFGGAAVAPDGTWKPTTAQQIPVNNFSSSIVVPKTSAVVITYSTSSLGAPTNTPTQATPTFPAPSVIPTSTPTPTPKSTSPSPILTCIPRPACLDATPPCAIALQPNMCPPNPVIPTDTPIPPLPPIITPAPAQHPSSFIQGVSDSVAKVITQVFNTPTPPAEPTSAGNNFASNPSPVTSLDKNKTTKSTLEIPQSNTTVSLPSSTNAEQNPSFYTLFIKPIFTINHTIATATANFFLHLFGNKQG